VWSGDTIIAARKARLVLRRLFKRGKIEIIPTRKLDDSGAALAHVSVNGIEIRRRLIYLGLAIALNDKKAGNPWCEWFLSR
jgi:hypothetical protein